jgi:hypothetical protein
MYGQLGELGIANQMLCLEQEYGFGLIAFGSARARLLKKAI